MKKKRLKNVTETFFCRLGFLLASSSSRGLFSH